MYITKYILYIFAHKLLICKKKNKYTDINSKST